MGIRTVDNTKQLKALDKTLIKHCPICQRKTPHFVMPIKPLRYIAGTSVYCLCCQECSALEGFDSLDMEEMRADNIDPLELSHHET